MAELSEIVQAALSLQERIGATKGFFLPWRQADKVVKKRWERWQHVCGDEKRFVNRLRWLGLLRNRGFAYAVLGSKPVPVKLPSWTGILDQVLHYEVQAEDALYLPQEPVPFAHLCLPFLAVARQRLRLSDRWSVVATPQILEVFCHQLLAWLVNLAGRAFLEQFSLFRLAKQPMLARLMMHLPNYHSDQLYQEFVAQQRQDKLHSFFTTYPVLARLMCRVTELWIEATQELTDRLVADYDLLAEKFGVSGKVEKVQPELGDPHNGGRTVTGLEFSNGSRVIYKPRSLQAEQAFAVWVDWVNSLGGMLDLKAARVVDRGEYGWMEFIEAEACSDRAQAQRYYQRLGQLLTLLHLLGANDCHGENLITQGEYPVLVDLETILNHEFRDTSPPGLGETSEALRQTQEFLNKSVIRVGLLPRWEGSGDKTLDLSGMGIGEQAQVVQVPKWEDINTDKMRVTQVPLEIRQESASPKADPREFVEEFLAGFQQAWQTIAHHKEQAPLAALQNLKVRSLFRSTQVYADIIASALKPQYLRNGIDFSIELERLARPLLWSEKVHPLAPIVEAEIKALWQYDIPCFWGNTSGVDIWAHNHQPLIKNCFTCPSIALVQNNLTHLTPTHLEQQMELIRGSLYAVDLQTTRPLDPQNYTWQDLAPTTGEEAIGTAVAIGEELARRAFRGRDGSVTWIGLGLVPNADKFRLQPVEYSLYDGAVGIALFLAALYRETGRTEWRQLAQGAVKPLPAIFLYQDWILPFFLDSVGLGGAVGLGSIIYGLTKISQFLGDKSLLDLADRFAQLVTPDLIAKDKMYDVLAGSAGAILGLLSLYRASHREHLVDRARECAHHLLCHRTPTTTGHLAWQGLDLPHLTGFSHGQTGIAYALVQLYSYTREEELLSAAQEAIAFEEAVFMPDRQNYPDFRNADPSLCMNSWCHGACGITLGRLGCLTTLDSADLRTTIERGLQTTGNEAFQTIDHLCCGNLGRMETLLTASQILERPDLAEKVKWQLANLLRRAQRVGGFYLLPHIPTGVFNPGFFQGLAGVGYAMLRIAKPAQYPSVLLWQ
ncbi:MAG: type 2 lanthipeptide synthetase LanM family protein [Pseudanabaenaceae cyanobacterium SKYGB_i_bin29]|nr:type 2 lanthipeptide synthetase LanM family protein [Pseudanabaenaceae cyanobacterium SKYG29]MDW8421662.1 type 2 lanthipeptide synthetase LanM family protein [Pseudanabaenaceae cyanobacterium SKYGB_i_bin29]